MIIFRIEFEDTKGVIKIRNSKDRKHNGQKKKDKRTNNNLQNITHKTKDRVTWTQLKTVGEQMNTFSFYRDTLLTFPPRDNFTVC